ncbi:MAG TPA: RNA polymerase sigma factor [Planctomycetota bacterium]|nr:RNA polymerase sigma factor [Planctomycetota bacterium]
MSDESASRSLSDEELVSRVVKGEKDPFRELFDRYRTRAYRVAYRFLGTHDDAMDAVQESFIKAYRSMSGFEGRSQFRTWLMRIVTNTCLDRRRGRSAHSAAPLSDEIVETTAIESQPHRRRETPMEGMEYAELRDALHKALEHLSDAHRTAFVLHTEEGLTYREIAETLDINEGTVMSRIYHARKNLQKILSNEGVL